MQKLVHGNSSTASQCTGNSNTATKLQTARNIKLQGAVSGNANFDGSKNIVINTENQNIAVIEYIISVNAYSTNEVRLNFPEGFTRDNSMVISWSTEEVYASNSNINFNGNIVEDHYSANLYFYEGVSQSIRIKVDNTKQSFNNEIKFKIVLMKF